MRILFAMLSLTLLAGCGGGDGPATAPVSGKVTLDGQPLAGATVNFATETFVGSGKTGSDGSFSLVTGAEVGENKVWISKFVAPEGGDFNDNPEEGLDAGQMEAAASATDDPTAAAPEPTGEQVPPDFSDSEKTILKFPVSESGTSSANFDLKSDS